jgi:CBS domain-containing protein
MVSLTARDVMEKNVAYIDVGATVSDAVRTMLSANTWSLVVEKDNLPIGVVTDRDILRRCLGKNLVPEKAKVEEIMTSPIISVSPGDHLGKVMELMVEKDIRRVFVVENGKIIGRVTQTKMFGDSLNVMLSLSSLSYQM